MSHGQIGIVLSKEDWQIIIRCLDHLVARGGMETIESEVIADYADTLFQRMSEAQTLRVREGAVPTRQDGVRTPEACICSVCSQYVAGGL